MVALTKNAIRKAASKAILNEVQFKTYLTQTEAIINEKLLKDLSDQETKALWPSDFLTPRTTLLLEPDHHGINQI